MPFAPTLLGNLLEHLWAIGVVSVGLLIGSALELH